MPDQGFSNEEKMLELNAIAKGWEVANLPISPVSIRLRYT